MRRKTNPPTATTHNLSSPNAKETQYGEYVFYYYGLNKKPENNEILANGKFAQYTLRETQLKREITYCCRRDKLTTKQR